MEELILIISTELQFSPELNELSSAELHDYLTNVGYEFSYADVEAALRCITIGNYVPELEEDF